MIGVEPSEPEPVPDEDQIEFYLRERLEHIGVLETKKRGNCAIIPREL